MPSVMYDQCHKYILYFECNYADVSLCHYAECLHAECHYAVCHYAECCNPDCHLLNVGRLSAIMLNVAAPLNVK